MKYGGVVMLRGDTGEIKVLDSDTIIDGVKYKADTGLARCPSSGLMLVLLLRMLLSMVKSTGLVNGFICRIVSQMWGEGY